MDGLEPGDFSSSTESSFSSVLSVKKSVPLVKPKDALIGAEPLPMIPPRAPVLETLKRTKRDLVTKGQKIKVGLGTVL